MKKAEKITIIVVLVIIFAFLVYIRVRKTQAAEMDVFEYKAYLRQYQTTAAGVTVCGYDTEGWVANGNSFPVIISRVLTGVGEVEDWKGVLEPEERVEMFISFRHDFIVRRQDGSVLGWVRPDPFGD